MKKILNAWILDLCIFSLTILIGWYNFSVPGGVDENILYFGFQRFLYSLFISFILVSTTRFMKLETLGLRWISRVSANKSILLIQVSIFFISIVIAGLQLIHFSIYEILDKDGFAGAQRLFSGMAQPNLHILPKAIVQMIQTVFMAFIATLFAVPIAFVISFFAARNVMNSPFASGIRQVIKFFLNLVSSVESLIWAIIFSVWVGIGPFAGVLALTIHSIVALARGFSELVEITDLGPVEGIRATGASQIQVVWFGILPQVILPFLSHSIYRWDINIRMATIVGLVGGGGIGTLMIQNLGQGLWHELGGIILVIAITVWILDFISSALREVLK